MVGGGWRGEGREMASEEEKASAAIEALAESYGDVLNRRDGTEEANPSGDVGLDRIQLGGGPVHAAEPGDGLEELKVGCVQGGLLASG